MPVSRPRTPSFWQNHHFIFRALVVLKLLVSLLSRLIACSARISVDRHTHTHTDTQTKYSNPRCACAPRVKNSLPVCFQGGAVDLQSQRPKTQNIGQKYRLSDVLALLPLCKRTISQAFGSSRSTLPLPVHTKPTSHLNAAANGECFRMGNALDGRTCFRVIL